MRKLLPLAAIFLLGGCYSLQGTPQIINAGGVVNQDENVSGPTEHLKNNFRYYLDGAVAKNASDDDVNAMLESGFLLVRANCDDFYTLMGQEQRVSHITRDLVAPIVTIAAGIIALTNFTAMSGQEDALEILALSSGAVLAGLDIHDKHFLFGAENIHEVRGLTFDALAAHRTGVLEQTPLTFEPALMHLIDHQVICTPSSILDLTRRAIAAGNVVARQPAENDSRDRQALVALGTALGLPGAASLGQAQVLWRLFHGGVAASEYPDLRAQLAALGDRNPFLEDGTLDLTSLGVESAEIMRILDRFSPAMRRAFADQREGLDGLLLESGNNDGARVPLDVE